MQKEHKKPTLTNGSSSEVDEFIDPELQEALNAMESFGVSQKLILVRSDNLSVLLVKNAHTSKWELPGGAVNKGEKLLVALTRELQEELGSVQYQDVDIVASTCVEYSILKKQFPVILLAYSGLYREGEITLSSEHTEYVWMTFSEVMKLEELSVAVEVKNFVQSAEKRIKERGYLNDVRRVSADFENYKRRQKENQAEMAGFLTEKLVMDIVPVLDNFHAATVHVPEEAASSPWVVGIQYIEKQLADALAGHGVAVIEPKVGDTFDPTMHEAIGNDHAHSSPSSNSEAGRGNEASGSRNQESGEENERKSHGKQVIAKVLQNGYRIGERVIRPAKVTVN